MGKKIFNASIFIFNLLFEINNYLPHLTKFSLSSARFDWAHLTLQYLALPRIPTSPRPKSHCLTSPCLALPHLTLPHLTSPRLASPCLALPCLASPCLTSPHIATHCHTSYCQTSHCPFQPNLTNLITMEHRTLKMLIIVSIPTFTLT
jgi:hypothetical protein